MEAVSREKFVCARCGNCCRWPGEVKIDAGEIDRMAAALAMRPEAFIERYTRLAGDRRGLSLTEADDGSCVFFRADPARCATQEAKPRQCVDFPTKWNFPGWENACGGTKTSPEDNR